MSKPQTTITEAFFMRRQDRMGRRLYKRVLPKIFEKAAAELRTATLTEQERDNLEAWLNRHEKDYKAVNA